MSEASKPESMNEKLHRALRSIIEEAKEKEGTVLRRKDRPTWNPKAHIELTLCAEDVWVTQDCLEMLDIVADVEGKR